MSQNLTPATETILIETPTITIKETVSQPVNLGTVDVVCKSFTITKPRVVVITEDTFTMGTVINLTPDEYSALREALGYDRNRYEIRLGCNVFVCQERN